MTDKSKPQGPAVAKLASRPAPVEAPSRRKLLLGAAAAAGAAAAIASPKNANAIAPPGAVEYPVAADPTRVPGRPPG